MAAHPRASSPPHVHTWPLEVLLTQAIDYAGLFPPAALSMTDAVREYAAYRTGADAWALGRFVLGVAQLEDFVLNRRAYAGDPWPVSVLVPGAADRDVASIAAQAAAHADILHVDAVESKVDSPAAIAALEPLKHVATELYVEIPADVPLGDLLFAIRSLGARAKLRTGGVTADAFPSALQVARFVRSCVDAGVPFKVTAGLHHLLRGEYALTYDTASPRGTMFGFLNVFFAAALACQHASIEMLQEVLEERDPEAFQLRTEEGQFCWRGTCLTRDELRAARMAISSFGSCSFEEPLAELTSAFARAT